MVSVSFTSCEEKIKTVHGLVTQVEASGDTLVSMKIRTGEDSLLFNLDEVKFNNGVMMAGDSVIVDYYSGEGDYNRAAVITLLPRPQHYLDEVVKPDAPLKSIDDSLINKTMQ